MVKANSPKKHHYVPQFYLRQFSCLDDVKKVPTLSLHNQFLVKKRCSISRIGYEDYLYRIKDKDIELCVEKYLNNVIETPISQSETWKKINAGKPELLNEADKLVIYIIMRHLESRNIEVLKFLENEKDRINDPKYAHEYYKEERMMYAEMASSSEGITKFFMGMASNTEQYAEQYKRASISIYGSNIPLRTSTNPLINVPVHMFMNAEFNQNEVTKWLPLSPSFGVMLFMSDRFCDFSEFKMVDDNVVKILNRLYLVQLLKSRTTRHMIASDKYIQDDLQWAGIKVDKKNPNKFKCSF